MSTATTPPSGAVAHRPGPRPIAAIVAVRLAAPAAPASVEAAIVRAMADAAPPVTAELVPLPLLSAADPCLLTYAAVLRPAPQRADDDPDRILADAGKVAKRALRRAFGPVARVAFRAADDDTTACACARAFAGNPRIPDPDENALF